MNDVSVKERLKNKRKETGKNFDELLVLYGIERLLYRISVSEHSDQFILKGGALLYTLLDNDARMTREYFWFTMIHLAYLQQKSFCGRIFQGL